MSSLAGNSAFVAGNLTATNVIEGYVTTATSGGTTTLTVSSSNQQYFTGTSNQTVQMPVTSTLTIGQSWLIVNNSTGIVTIQSSGGNTIITLSPTTQTTITCILTSGTSASSWNYANNAIFPGAIVLTDTHIFVGNTSNVATDVAMSGDATIDNTGALTLATVNAGPGSTTLSSITTNAKGLVTSNTTGNLTGDVISTGLATTYNNIVPILKGGTGVSSVTIAPTATAWAGWDANKNLSANNAIEGYTTTVTAAGTTTLNVASTYQQYFTGSTTQTVQMPVTSTLVLGQSWNIVNISTGAVTIVSSGSNTIVTLPASTQIIVTCILTSGTTAASWSATSIATTPGAIPLTNTHILVGNASNVAADVAMSGDATIANTGALTLATVNVSSGSTTLSSITTNAKGLVTSNTTGNLTGDVTSTGLATTYNNIVSATKGGTGVNNGSSTITLGGSLTTSGAFASTFTMTNTTAVTFPTSGTLVSTTTGTALTKTDDTNVTLTLGGSPSTALVNAASITAGWTGQLSIARGGTNVSSVTTAPTATAWAGWDANKNLSANNAIEGYTTTVTAAGTTTLTVASTYQQYFTGSTTQTVQMPVASTLVLGQSWNIVNISTGAVTVQSSGSNTIVTLPASTQIIVTCILTSGTTAASWSATSIATTPGAIPLTSSHILVGNASNVAADVAMSGDISISNTGSTSIVATTNATLTTLSALTTASSLVTVGTITSGTWSATNIALNKGGTNASLTATAGGVFYSTASAGAISAAGTAATQMFQSGTSGTGTPAWSSNIWPSTNAQGDLIYGSASNTITTLAKSTTATRYLANTGTSNNPNWDQINLTNGVTGVLPSANGGTGVNNGSSTITLGGSLTTSGAFASTFTMTNTTGVTFPTSGTLVSTTTGTALTSGNDTNVTLTLGGSPSTALVNAASITAGWTGQLSIARGGTGVSSVATVPVVNSWAGWDSNKNISANNFIEGYTTTATAGSSTTLSVGSAYLQYFTGSANQTVQMPGANTVVLGQQWNIVNISTGVVTIQSSGSNTIVTLPPSTQIIVTCILTSGTTAASWSATSITTTPGAISLTNTHILVGNSSNVAADVAMSGDISITNTGSTSIVATSNSTLTTLSGLTTASSLATVGTITSGTWSGTIIALNKGGTNANLTASNGGIFYSTASAGAILAGTATARQMLQSGASTTPAWSATTWPATTTANQILYSSATSVIGEITTGNNGVLITSGGGVPSISSTLPSAVQANITQTGTLTSVVNTTNTTAATSSTTGSIITSGGVGIAKNIWIGSAFTAANSTVDGSILNIPAFTYTTSSTTPTNINIHSINQVTINATGSTTATNAASLYIANAPTNTGNLTSITNKYALQVAAGTSTFQGSTASTSSTLGTILTAGGIGISNATDASSSTNGGSFTTAGGMAVAQQLYVGGNLRILNSSNLVLTDGTQTGTINMNAGSLTIANGIPSNSTVTISGSQLSLTSSTPLLVNSTTAATSSSTGSITTLGGVGIAKNMWIGSAFTAANSTVDGSITNIPAFTYTTSTSSPTNVNIDAINIVTLNGTGTATNAASLYIAGAPAAGTLAITNKYALQVAAGTSTFQGTTTSTSSSTGTILTAGGIGISNATDASNTTNGGTFTTAGGMAVAKSLYQGSTAYFNTQNNGAVIVKASPLDGYNSGVWSATQNSGLQIGWNNTGASGEVDFLCNSQFGSGGSIFSFWYTNSGNTTPTQIGSIDATGYHVVSDYRMKDNVKNLDSERYNVDQLRPVSYIMKNSKQKGLGFIAHEVQEIFPELVSGEKDCEHNQSLNTTGMIPVLVLEIQHLKAQVQTSNAQILDLQNQVQTLIAQMQSLLAEKNGS